MEKGIDEVCKKIRLVENFGRVEKMLITVLIQKGDFITKGAKKHLDDYIDNLKSNKSSLNNEVIVKNNLIRLRDHETVLTFLSVLNH